MIKNYYQLTKPGIIYGNAVTVAGGFFLASKGSPDWPLLLATLVGISLVVASGCVFNNYIDRDIDALMERTKERELVRGVIPLRNALYFGGLLGLLGVAILTIYTNMLTVAVGLVGFFFYVVLYGIWKRRSVYGTHIGSIAGAVPPVVGYVAVANTLDTGAVLLFFILVFWQMPHFFAIAMYRLEDYKAAKIPVMPIARNVRRTKIEMVMYILGFIITTHLLTAFHYTSITYLAVLTMLGFAWLGLAVSGFWAPDDRRWARKMFLFSLLIIMLFSFMVSINALLSTSALALQHPSV